MSENYENDVKNWCKYLEKFAPGELLFCTGDENKNYELCCYMDEILYFWRCSGEDAKITKRARNEFEKRAANLCSLLLDQAKQEAFKKLCELYRKWCTYQKTPENIDINFVNTLRSAVGPLPQPPKQQQAREQQRRVQEPELEEKRQQRLALERVLEEKRQQRLALEWEKEKLRRDLERGGPSEQPPQSPPERVDIMSLFFIPSLCTVASGLTFLLLRHNLNGIMVLLVALAVLGIGICVAKPLFKVFKVDTTDVHLKKAIGLAIVYELVVFLIFLSCDPVWYYHLLVVLCPFLVAAKSFVFIRNDYPHSKFLLTVLLLAVIPVFDVSTFFVYHSSIPPVRNSDIQTQTLSGRSPQKPLPAPDAPSSSTTPTSDEQLLKEDIFPKEDGSTVALPPGIEWRSQIRKKEKASTSMNLEQKFNEILTKSSNRVAIGNFVVSPFPLSTEGSALAVKITRRRSRLNSAKVAKDAEKQVAEAYQVDHVSYNLKSALRSFFHRYRVPEQQYEYQCVIMKQYVLDMQSQLLLTDLDRDQFRNLKYTLFSGKSSDDAIKGMLDQFEQGKLNICRYEISGRMISYSEKHVLISRTMEKIDFEIQTSMLVEVDMTDRLTGDKKTVKHNLTTRKPASISVDYRRRYLSTARLRFDRSSVFKASSQELARLISEDLKQLTSK